MRAVPEIPGGAGCKVLRGVTQMSGAQYEKAPVERHRGYLDRDFEGQPIRQFSIFFVIDHIRHCRRGCQFFAIERRSDLL